MRSSESLREVMPGPAPYTPRPPPSNWPCRVRSTAVYAVSLADLAFTKALRWTANALNPRLRHQAELEQLLREISLLREEILIDDARMEHTEAQQ